MKIYGKKTDKLFQVRLSKKEYDRVVLIIKNLGITRRIWILNKTKKI